MPTLSDFLWAPWRLFTALGWIAAPSTLAPIAQAVSPATPLGGPAPDLHAAAHSSICYAVQEGTGQTQALCRAFGYEMPRFVFFAALGIFIFFLVSSVRLYRECQSLTTRLHEMTVQLRAIALRVNAKGTAALTVGELDAMRDVMKQDPVVHHHWEQFEATLLVDDESVYSTCGVESILSKPALVDAHLNADFYNSVPGILTGVGLLMTFVAILDGLSHVTVGANMEVHGISGLINGLSGKFVSSIVAVGCAVLFVFVERASYAGPTRAYQEFLARLNARFRRRTTEHLLFSIQNTLKKRGA